METIIVSDTASLAQAAADLIEAEISPLHSTMLGLAGGSTPAATYDVLAGRTIDWSTTTAWIPDERWVPPDDDASNQLMARTALTDRVNLRLFAPDTTGDDPVASARGYSDMIAPLLAADSARSITMLGMGTDGHTASLFPGTTALRDTSDSYVANFVPQLDTWRITATFGLLALSDVVMFLVSGEAKAEKVAEIASGAEYPAGRVTARERVVWLLDEAAASGLSR